MTDQVSETQIEAKNHNAGEHPTRHHTQIAIIHNHPIHYKHLLLAEMKRMGLDFTVLFMASQSTIRNEKIQLSSDLYNSRVGYDGPYETAPAFTRMRFVFESLRQIQPKVLIISGNYALECWVGWLWALLHRVPVILWFESNEFDFPRRFPKEWLKSLFLAGCVGAHVYGKSNKAYLHKLGMPADTILVKRAVVNVDLFATPRHLKPAVQPGVRKLLYVGRFSDEKNLEFLIRAFASQVSQPNPVALTLTLVGYGPNDAELRSLVDSLGIARWVHFTGPIRQQDLPATMRAHDFLILPSTREPWGLVAPEAMLCRLPILVSTQCGCASDLVTPETGWIFSPWKLEELSSLVGSLRHLSPSEIESMGDSAYEVAKHYSAHESAHAILQGIGRVKHSRYQTPLPAQ